MPVGGDRQGENKMRYNHRMKTKPLTLTYGKAEVETREKLLGLWKDRKPTTPWGWKRN